MMRNRKTTLAVGRIGRLLLIAGGLVLPSPGRVDPSEPPPQEAASSVPGPARILWLGVRVCERQLIVQSVVEGAPAAAAGITPGERIHSVNGESNLEDIHDDVNAAGSNKPITVVVGRGGATRKVRIVPSARPAETLRRDETVYLPESTITEVEPGSPLASIDCRAHCTGVVPECVPILVRSIDYDGLHATWGDTPVFFEGDFWGRTFKDRTDCLKEAQERCSCFI